MDYILSNILFAFSSILLGYLIGSIPNGIIISKIVAHKDPRDYHSKNSGGTNVGRIAGKAAGIITILMDMIKGALPAIIVYLVVRFSNLNDIFIKAFGANKGIWDNGTFYVYLAAFSTAFGHCFPVFANFRGGKAVASVFGFGIFSSWFLIILGVSSFFIILRAKKYVSLSSMLTSAILAILAWIMYGLDFVEPLRNVFMWGWGNFFLSGWEYALCLTLCSILIIVRHSSNIKRLIAHTENKTRLFK